jgi:hypothetical protein
MIALEPRPFYDHFIVGLMDREDGEGQVIVYDEDRLVEGLTKNILEDAPETDEIDAYHEALGHYEFNVKAGSMVKGGPVFVSRRDWERALEKEE